ncbi:MAG: tetratricopeptide repeat protein [Ignavibacterium sp.]|nr:MAG: tetratricopeptide repeat protein [Ignavibacterium sp.]
MNIFAIIAISSVALVIIWLLIKTNFAGKRRIRYKERVNLNQYLEEQEIAKKSSVIPSQTNPDQIPFGSKNQSSKISLSKNKQLEEIVDDITAYDSTIEEENLAYTAEFDAYYENQPDAVDFAQHPDEKSTKTYELGVLLLKEKKYKESIEYFDKAIEINPADGVPFYYRGIAKSNINLADQAIEDYTDAMLRKLNIIDVFYQRGISKYKVGDKKGALDDLTRYVSIVKSNAEAYYIKGLLEFEKEEYSDAIADFNRTIILNPNHESAYFKRGMAKHHTGNKEGCCKDLKSAYEKGNLEAFHYMKQFCKE